MTLANTEDWFVIPVNCIATPKALYGEISCPEEQSQLARLFIQAPTSPEVRLTLNTQTKLDSLTGSLHNLYILIK